MIEQIKEIVASLAEALGCAVEYVYPRLVDYFVWDACSDCITACFFLVLSLIFIFSTKDKTKTTDSDEIAANGVVFVGGIIMGIMSLIATSMTLPNMIKALAAPEGYAMMKIINLVK